MSTSILTYKHSILRAERNEIRLIRLHPGQSYHDICIDIFHVDPSLNPSYEALSYAWGDPTRSEKITVRSRSPASGRSNTTEYPGTFTADLTHTFAALYISRNLAIALRHLRLPKDVRTLWIDAISINQDDIEERSEEVAKMGSLYSNAWRVIVWLGGSSQDSLLALQTLRNIRQDTDFFEKDGLRSFLTRGETGELERSPNGWRAEVLKWIAIRSLLNRPWFGRLWIFQEIGHAKKAVVVVGKDELSWEAFRVAVFWIIYMTEGKAPLSDIFDAAYLRQIDSLLQENPGRALERLLDSTKKAICFDPRDRIYAILSLLHPYDPIRKAIEPDYAKSVEQVYQEVTVRQIQLTSQLRLLALCSFWNSESTLQLPSWVPDLSIPNPLEQILNSNASGPSNHKSPLTLSERYLTIRGTVAGVISEILTPITLSARLPEILAVCYSWEPPNAAATAYVTGGDLMTAFITTLFFGAISELNDFGMPLEYDKLRGVYENTVVRGVTDVIEDDGDDNVNEWYNTRHLQSYLPGRALFRTKEGHIGLCPAAARVGDSIVIAYGCATPLVLRPAFDHYFVGGECYVSGLMNGEALFGPLPQGWTLQSWKAINREKRPIFKSPTGRTTLTDPRLQSLSKGSQISFLPRGKKRRYSVAGQGRSDDDEIVTGTEERNREQQQMSGVNNPKNLLPGLMIKEFVLI
ncbi:heterokaryon incompatibility protein-domain-containing protein [Rhexocercosporidium sp. MPI-PUGE-AT-0058]|nr:heterokaryon incompatibility protein-domain-containing protein [Rhexocercosporidium sp. MPI-PUGE-AT-0058]